MPGGDDALVAHLADVIDRRGPIGFDTFLEVALYDPRAGFYTGSGGRAGSHEGQFLTSPEVGPLFGAVLGRALDTWWDELGRPDPYLVVEAGAGPGTLARTVRAAMPRCASALTYVLVERSAAQRALHAEYLDLVDPARALPPGLVNEGAAGGTGPRWTSVAELPTGRVRGIVMANELLDNVPFRLLARGAARWNEVRVGVDAGGVPVEVVVPADPSDAALAERLAPGVTTGSRVPVQAQAAAWLRGALDLLEVGRVLVLDYGDDTAGLAARPWASWLRTYRHHQRGGHPLEQVGVQDVTCEVAVDQLAQVRPPVANRSQAEFLAHHGIHELVEEGRRTWEERAHIGDLAALTARSRVREAEALLDPAGLGSFRAMEWVLGP